jgi:hypothetical protein
MTKKFKIPSRKKTGKKAEADTQLNWIFILIVGAIILTFFTFIVIKQRGASEAKFAGKVSQQINTILVGAKAASGTVQEITTPDVSIRFTCNDYYIGVASQRLGNKVVFSPEYIEGSKIITWTLDWDTPFRVTSFLYITTPDIRYVFVSEDIEGEAVRRVIEALPEQLNKEIISIADYEAGNLQDEGDKKIRFVFVNLRGMFTIPTEFEEREVSGVSINTEAKTIQFLTREEGELTRGNEYQYVGVEEVYGAIFTDKEENYRCLAERAYTRLNMVSRVYTQKLNEIHPLFVGKSCEGYYFNNEELNALQRATGTYPPNYPEITRLQERLEYVNEHDLKLRSCPLIY